MAPRRSPDRARASPRLRRSRRPRAGACSMRLREDARHVHLADPDVLARSRSVSSRGRTAGTAPAFREARARRRQARSRPSSSSSIEGRPVPATRSAPSRPHRRGCRGSWSSMPALRPWLRRFRRCSRRCATRAPGSSVSAPAAGLEPGRILLTRTASSWSRRGTRMAHPLSRKWRFSSPTIVAAA